MAVSKTRNPEQKRLYETAIGARKRKQSWMDNVRNIKVIFETGEQTL